MKTMRVKNVFTIVAVVVSLGIFRGSISIVDAQKLRTASTNGITRLQEKETSEIRTLRQYIVSLEIGDDTDHHRLLTRLLEKPEENKYVEKCNVCNNVLENIPLEGSFATTRDLGTVTTTKTSSTTITATNDPAQCFEDIITWLNQKVRLSLFLIFYDIAYTVSAIILFIPCLLGIQDQDDCSAIIGILVILIYTSLICLIFFPINLIDGFLTCGNPTFLERFGPQFNITSTLDKKKEGLGSLMAIIEKSGDKTRRLLPDFEGVSSEQKYYAEQIDKMLDSISEQTIRFLINDINEHYIDNESEFEVHHIAGRYLQSTLIANQTIRNIPNLFLQGYDDFHKSFLNSTTTMTVQTSIQMNELRSMLDTVLSNIPYDPNGIDAQIKFNFDKDTLGKLTKHTSMYLSMDDGSRRLFTVAEYEKVNGGSTTTQTRRAAAAAAGTKKCTMDDFITCTPTTALLLDSIELEPSTGTNTTVP